jgi:triacylglycerol lipase
MTNSAPDPAPPWQPSDLPTLRAAYSDRTATLMAYLSAFAYDGRIQATPPLQVPTELSQLGFRELTPFHNGMDDGWAYIAQANDIVVLAFRGTQSIKNWHTNFQVRLVHPDGTDPKLLVHEGFYNAFIALDDPAVYFQKRTCTYSLQRKMQEIKQTTNGAIPIYITGHSLGGALAQIATAVFGSDQIAACYTFGSPRVGNSYFDLWVKPPSYRVMNYADIVPTVPFPFVYRHSGDPRYMPDVVQASPFRFQPGLLQRLWQCCRGLVQLFRSGSILGIEDHSIQLYCTKLDDVARVRIQSR